MNTQVFARICVLRRRDEAARVTALLAEPLAAEVAKEIEQAKKMTPEQILASIEEMCEADVEEARERVKRRTGMSPNEMSPALREYCLKSVIESEVGG